MNAAETGETAPAVRIVDLGKTTSPRIGNSRKLPPIMDEPQSLRPTFRRVATARKTDLVEAADLVTIPPLMEEHDPRDGEEYMPTPEQIREACAEIQREWSPQQEAHRRLQIPHAYRDPDNFTPAEALERVTSWRPPGAKRHAP